MSSHPDACETLVSADQGISGAISRVLHQAAQPLSILQGTLELALAGASTVDEFKIAIEQSLQELLRVTDSFEHLRTLAQLQQPVADITTFAVSSMVEGVLASLERHSASAGVELVLQLKLDDRRDSGEGRVKMSRNRVSTALKMALSELLLVLKRGSKVFVLIETDATDVLIRVDTVASAQQSAQLTNTPARGITPRQELAQAMTASVGGRLTFCPSSSELLIRLPHAPLTSVGGEAELLKDQVAHV
jgi:hypothetical protein